MLEAAVCSGGKDVVYQPSLFYALQPLQNRGVYDSDLMSSKKLVPQEGVVEDLGALRQDKPVILEERKRLRITKAASLIM
jgi:hypothetical protein